MRKTVTTLLEVFPAKALPICCLLLALSGGAFPPAEGFAQDTKPIYDARLTLHSTKLSDSEGKLFQEKIVSSSRRAWHEDEDDQACEPGFEPTAVDITRGSFTKPNADQKALLYRFCSTGHNMALNGIGILENDRVVAHIVYEGTWENAVGALPDSDGDGLAEILVASGGTNQGETWSTITILELPEGRTVTKFGRTQTLSDNRGGSAKNCRVEASRISVKMGKPPAFFRETFLDRGASGGKSSWKKSAALSPILLEEDKNEYQFIE